MIRLVTLVLMLAACTQTSAELPEDFDPSFQFFVAPVGPGNQ